MKKEMYSFVWDVMKKPCKPMSRPQNSTLISPIPIITKETRFFILGVTWNLLWLMNVLFSLIPTLLLLITNRAETLDELGRTQEAALARAKARELRNKGSL